jgi:hypothetical protein
VPLPRAGGEVCSQERTLQRGAVCWFAVGGEHQLNRQVEERAQPTGKLRAAHVCAPAELEVESGPEVGQRITDDDRPDG